MKPFVDTCIRFFKKETVLCVAGILAFISAFFVHPSAAYIGYRLPGPFPAFLSYAGGGWISEYWSFSFSRLCTAYKSTDYTAINTGAFPAVLLFQHVHHQ